MMVFNFVKDMRLDSQVNDVERECIINNCASELICVVVYRHVIIVVIHHRVSINFEVCYVVLVSQCQI